jgi:gliding motility-associated-like protein
LHAFELDGNLTVRLDAFYRACPDTYATRKVWVFKYPKIYIGPDLTICPGSTPITLTDLSNANVPGTRWLWSNGETGNSMQVVSPGTYWAKITVAGCTATDSVIVTQDCYLDVPNAFTPNDDGINDYFLPRPLLGKGLSTFTMNIYNRWGQLLFETNQTEGRGWDGKFNGISQPEGVYVYTIDVTFKDGQKEKHQGNVTLLK